MNRIERIAGSLVAGSMNLKEIKELGKEVAGRVMEDAEQEINELAVDYAERRGELDQEEMEKAKKEYKREAFRALAALAEKASKA